MNGTKLAEEQAQGEQHQGHQGPHQHQDGCGPEVGLTKARGQEDPEELRDRNARAVNRNSGTKHRDQEDRAHKKGQHEEEAAQKAREPRQDAGYEVAQVSGRTLDAAAVFLAVDARFDVPELFFDRLADVVKGCRLALHGQALRRGHGLGCRSPKHEVEDYAKSGENSEYGEKYANQHHVDVEVVGDARTNPGNLLFFGVAVKATALGLCGRIARGVVRSLFAREVLGLPQRVHGRLHVVGAHDLAGAAHALGEDFGDARFDVGEHFFAALGGSEVAAQGLEVARKHGVGVFVEVKEQSAQVDVNGLFHEFFREFTASTNEVHSEFMASKRMRPDSVSW